MPPIRSFLYGCVERSLPLRPIVTASKCSRDLTFGFSRKNGLDRHVRVLPDAPESDFAFTNIFSSFLRKLGESQFLKATVKGLERGKGDRGGEPGFPALYLRVIAPVLRVVGRVHAIDPEPRWLSGFWFSEPPQTNGPGNGRNER